MTHFDEYRDRFPNARLTRSKSGVLEVALHTDGGVLVFNGHTHEQFVNLFHVIGSDSDNRVVIPTGSGDAFMETIAPDGFDFSTPRGYDKDLPRGQKGTDEYPGYRSADDCRRERAGAAAFGIHPACRHRACHPVGSLSGQASFRTRRRSRRRSPSSLAGGDWHNPRSLLHPHPAGAGRQTAKEWGAVNEIVPADKLLPRARGDRGRAGEAPAATDHQLYPHRADPEAASDHRRRCRARTSHWRVSVPTLLGEASVIRETLSRGSRRLADRIGRLIIFASRAAFDVGSSPMTPRKLSPRPHTTSSISRTITRSGSAAGLQPLLRSLRSRRPAQERASPGHRF